MRLNVCIGDFNCVIDIFQFSSLKLKGNFNIINSNNNNNNNII